MALLALASASSCNAAASPQADFEKANQLYDAGKFAEAKAIYTSLVDAKHFSANLFYNLGNTQYRLGEEAEQPQAKQTGWEQAVASYESALTLNPQDADAKHNLELVKKRLEELKQQQQQQKQSGDDKKDESKKDQSKNDQQKQDQKSESNKEEKQDQQQQEQKPDQAGQKPDSPKQDQDQSEAKDAQGKQGEKDDKGEKPEGDTAAKMTRAIQMTPQQAQQLLDAQKSEEKAMIFVPQIKTNRTDRVFKDW